MMIRFLPLGLVASLASADLCCGQQKPLDDFLQLRTSYQKAKDQALDPITDRYLDSLSALKSKYTQAGNLEAVVAIDQTIKRGFDPAGEVPKANPADAELERLRTKYEGDLNRASAPLAKKYIEALEPIRVKYTQMAILRPR